MARSDAPPGMFRREGLDIVGAARPRRERATGAEGAWARQIWQFSGILRSAVRFVCASRTQMMARAPVLIGKVDREII